MELNFNTLKQVENLKADLMKAYQKTARLMSDKHELEKKLETLEQKLAKDSGIANVLKDAKHRAVKELTTDKKFLKDVEAAAVAEYKKLKRIKGKVKPTSTDEKVQHLKEIFTKAGNKALKTAELKAALIERKALAAGGNLQQWLKALDLPEDAVEALGAKRDGMSYKPAKMPFLKD